MVMVSRVNKRQTFSGRNGLSLKLLRYYLLISMEFGVFINFHKRLTWVFSFMPFWFFNGLGKLDVLPWFIGRDAS
jgi:hypothetical protein